MRSPSQIVILYSDSVFGMITITTSHCLHHQIVMCGCGVDYFFFFFQTKLVDKQIELGLNNQHRSVA